MPLWAVAARRAERLDAVVEEMGTGVSLAGDATDPDDVRRFVDEAADALDGLDLVVYAAGLWGSPAAGGLPTRKYGPRCIG